MSVSGVSGGSGSSNSSNESSVEEKDESNESGGASEAGGSERSEESDRSEGSDRSERSEGNGHSDESTFVPTIVEDRPKVELKPAEAREEAPPDWPRGPLAPSEEVNPEVETVQRRLVEQGYLDEAQVSGVYGDQTEEAVSDFQLANGLLPTGAADTVTLARMGSPAARTEAEAVEALAGRPERVISQIAGAPGPSPKPVLDPDAPREMIVRSSQNVNCRESPETGTPLDTLSPGTVVTVVEPQPSGGQEGWLYVSGQGQQGPVSGWVSTGLMEPKPPPVDRRVDTRLQDLGYLPPDGTTDARAIENFQAMNKLPVTGELDQRTLDAMWSPAARESFHVVQFQDATYNATKLSGSGNAAGDNNCGPASVAMALASVGLAELDNADPQALVAQLRADSGTIAGNTTGPGALETAAQANGAETYRVDSMDEVKLAVMRGDPVVLYGVPNRDGTYYNAPADEGSIDPGAGHWVSVVGYDPQTDTFIVNDPLCRDGTRQLTQEQLTTYADFNVDSVAVHAPPPPPAPYYSVG